jgi:hypothetical protein
MSKCFHYPVATIAIYRESCPAFDEGLTVGSKVINQPDFLSHVSHAIKAHDFKEDGQGFLVLPETVFEHVSAGDGEHTHDPADYVVAEHRGRVDAYLTRKQAGDVKFCAVVVYTREAYLADPEVNVSLRDGIEHVIVAVLASSAPECPLPPWTLMNNISGGNNKFLLSDAVSGDDRKRLMAPPRDLRMTVVRRHDAQKAHEWRDMAKLSLEYWKKYSIVAG